MKSGKTEKKLALSIALIVLLSLCLCITLFALFYSMVSVNDNRFLTGTVEINLNDGKPVIEADEFLFEPGMTVKKDFFIENDGSCDVFCRLYFDRIEGSLADVLEVTLTDGARTVYSGKASEFTRENVGAVSKELEIGEKRELTLWFSCPVGTGNSAQGKYLAFDICADAVQVRNNPDRQFE